MSKFAELHVVFLKRFGHIFSQLYWLEYSAIFEKGALKRSDLKGQNVEIVLDNQPFSTRMTIDYESLYILEHMSKVTN